MARVIINKKGFTMIELMIVITVIGILAIVLLPRISGIRNDARTAGVEANMRATQSVAELEISRYRLGEEEQFGERLESRLSDVANPFTGNEGTYYTSVGIGNKETLADNMASAGAILIVKGLTNSAIIENDENLANRLGKVLITIHQNEGRLSASIYGYDSEGYYIPVGKNTINR